MPEWSTKMAKQKGKWRVTHAHYHTHRKREIEIWQLRQKGCETSRVLQKTCYNEQQWRICNFNKINNYQVNKKSYILDHAENILYS